MFKRVAQTNAPFAHYAETVMQGEIILDIYGKTQEGTSENLRLTLTRETLAKTVLEAMLTVGLIKDKNGMKLSSTKEETKEAIDAHNQGVVDRHYALLRLTGSRASKAILPDLTPNDTDMIYPFSETDKITEASITAFKTAICDHICNTLLTQWDLGKHYKPTIRSLIDYRLIKNQDTPLLIFSFGTQLQASQIRENGLGLSLFTKKPPFTTTASDIQEISFVLPGVEQGVSQADSCQLNMSGHLQSSFPEKVITSLHATGSYLTPPSKTPYFMLHRYAKLYAKTTQKEGAQMLCPDWPFQGLRSIFRTPDNIAHILEKFAKHHLNDNEIPVFVSALQTIFNWEGCQHLFEKSTLSLIQNTLKPYAKNHKAYPFSLHSSPVDSAKNLLASLNQLPDAITSTATQRPTLSREAQMVITAHYRHQQVLSLDTSKNNASFKSDFLRHLTEPLSQKDMLSHVLTTFRALNDTLPDLPKPEQARLKNQLCPLLGVLLHEKSPDDFQKDPTLCASICLLLETLGNIETDVNNTQHNQLLEKLQLRFNKDIFFAMFLEGHTSNTPSCDKLAAEIAISKKILPTNKKPTDRLVNALKSCNQLEKWLSLDPIRQHYRQHLKSCKNQDIKKTLLQVLRTSYKQEYNALVGNLIKENLKHCPLEEVVKTLKQVQQKHDLNDDTAVSLYEGEYPSEIVRYFLANPESKPEIIITSIEDAKEWLDALNEPNLVTEVNQEVPLLNSIFLWIEQDMMTHPDQREAITKAITLFGNRNFDAMINRQIQSRLKTLFKTLIQTPDIGVSIRNFTVIQTQYESCKTDLVPEAVKDIEDLLEKRISAHNKAHPQGNAVGKAIHYLLFTLKVPALQLLTTTGFSCLLLLWITQPLRLD